MEETCWGRTVWVDAIEESFGGNGANTAYTLARLGTPARLLAMAGADEAGDRVLGRLQLAGVDTAHVLRSALPTPATVVLVNGAGARALLHRPGASREAFEGGIELTGVLTHGCGWFHLANVFALPALRPHAGKLLARARQSGLSVSIDTGWDARGEWMDVLGPCLPYADLLFVNEDEARELTGERHPMKAARCLREAGAASVVVKLGAAGCLVCSGDDSFESPAFRVTPVDTTGAGDCFVGAFQAALTRGMPHADAARFANAVGALSVQQLGGTTGLLSFDETIAWMDARK